MMVPLYEVYLLGNGKPEKRFTDKPLKLGDVVEFGNRAWRVQTEDPGTNGVAARFVCIRNGARTLHNGPVTSSRKNGGEAFGVTDKLGVLREAAARAARQRAKTPPGEGAPTRPPA